MRRFFPLAAGLIILIFCFGQLGFSQSIPSPPDFFGFKIGSDRKLLDWKQLLAYFDILSKKSERLKISRLGKTTLGKPFILATISSKKNMENLDIYRSIQQKIANPYDLAKKEAAALIKKGKVVVLLSIGRKIIAIQKHCLLFLVILLDRSQRKNL